LCFLRFSAAPRLPVWPPPRSTLFPYTTLFRSELGVHALHIKYRLLKPRLLEACRQENIAVRVYTVNKKAHMMRCFAKGCDGFFTDVPDKGIAYRKLMLDY